tara:strand:- start:772 stop:951 length:180 start_codon:yes stop_codon:yes gene_type:complete
MKYEIHIGVTGNTVLELEADSMLDAEIAAQDLVDTGKIAWDEYDLDIVAVESLSPAAQG